ncbi:MAG: HAD family hydrolase [Spirochaetes bacterium]|nr:HAD family hydrolase [Spirochaetota bacterium]
MNKAFLIDMDGVLYRGSELIPGADTFINKLLERQIPFLFMTNNSQRTRRDIMTKLNRMGIKIGVKHVFTSAIATARFLARQRPNGTAFVIGEGGLLTALHDEEYSIVDHDPDFVVIGEGRSLNMENLDMAVKMVYDGAKLIATNLDANCPTQDSVRPGCGAFVAMIEKATGKEAFSVGKPSPVMLRMARKELDVRTAETTIIGDMMSTDILGGVQIGYRTILVLSGGTSRADLKNFSYLPNLIVNSIADINIDE